MLRIKFTKLLYILTFLVFSLQLVMSAEIPLVYKLGLDFGQEQLDLSKGGPHVLNPSSDDDFTLIFKPVQNAYMYILYFDELYQLRDHFPKSKKFMRSDYKKMEVYQFPSETSRFVPKNNDSIYIIASNKRLTELENAIEAKGREKNAKKARRYDQKIWNYIKKYQAEIVDIKAPRINPSRINGVIYRGDSNWNIDASEVKCETLDLVKIVFK